MTREEILGLVPLMEQRGWVFVSNAEKFAADLADAIIEARKANGWDYPEAERHVSPAVEMAVRKMYNETAVAYREQFAAASRTDEPLIVEAAK